MAKSKVGKWLIPDGLTLLSGWAREGLTDEQIATNMGIAPSTLYDWKNKHLEISEALKKEKEIVDYEVENALYKKCLGYNAKVLKNIKVKTIKYSEVTGKKISESEEIKEVYDEIHVPADIIWLKNRKPDKWRDKPQDQNKDKKKVVIVNDMPKW